jgi:RNA polymerase sigma-70 factor, ECF subfamily
MCYSPLISKMRDPMSSNDPSKFVHLLMANQLRLYAFIRAQVLSLDDAEEVLQQTSAILWEKYSTLQDEEDFARLACKVARLVVLKHFRNTNRIKPLLSEIASEALLENLTAQSLTIDARQEALTECLKELPPRGRRLVSQVYLEGDSVKNIAARLGRSAPSIYRALDQIRLALFHCIQKRLADSE